MIALQEQYGKMKPFKMWHAGAHLENIQRLQVKLRKTGGSLGQIELQGVQVGMKYEKNIKQGKPEHTGTAWMQLP